MFFVLKGNNIIMCFVVPPPSLKNVFFFHSSFPTFSSNFSPCTSTKILFSIMIELYYYYTLYLFQLEQFKVFKYFSIFLSFPFLLFLSLSCHSLLIVILDIILFLQKNERIVLCKKNHKNPTEKKFLSLAFVSSFMTILSFIHVKLN